MPTFHYTVDGEPQQTEHHQLTVCEILSNAGVNPDERYLIELRGKDQFPLRDLNAEVHLSEREKFITAFIGPVPVA